MRQFDISFTCSEERLSTIVSVIAHEVSNLQITERFNSRSPKAPPATPPPEVNGHEHDLVSHTRVGKLILEFLTAHAFATAYDLKQLMVANGFNENSASPALSGLRKIGRVTQVERGRWEIAK